MALFVVRDASVTVYEEKPIIAIRVPKLGPLANANWLIIERTNDRNWSTSAMTRGAQRTHTRAIRSASRSRARDLNASHHGWQTRKH